MSEIDILKNILQTIPNMDSENITSIIKSYTDVDYYNTNNIPLRLELDYYANGFPEEFNVSFIQNKFYIIKNVKCYIECRIGVKDGKYFKYEGSTKNCTCEAHSERKSHMNFKEYQLKTKDEGYYYVESLHNYDHIYKDKGYNYDKFLYEYKILQEISLKDIKNTILILEEWYKSYMHSELDDEDSDIDNSHKNKLIRFKTLCLPCHDMDGDKLYNLFENIYNKFYESSDKQ